MTSPTTNPAVDALRLKVLLCLEYEKQRTPLSRLRLGLLALASEELLVPLLDLSAHSPVASEAWLRQAWEQISSSIQSSTLPASMTTISGLLTRLQIQEAASLAGLSPQ